MAKEKECLPLQVITFGALWHQQGVVD